MRALGRVAERGHARGKISIYTRLNHWLELTEVSPTLA
jgi:hypothetical protein